MDAVKMWAAVGPQYRNTVMMNAALGDPNARQLLTAVAQQQEKSSRIGQWIYVGLTVVLFGIFAPLFWWV